MHTPSSLRRAVRLGSGHRSATVVRRLVMTCCCCSLATVSAQAAVIAYWDMSEEPGNQGATLGVGSSNVTAVNMTRGSGLGTETYAGSMNSKGWNSPPALGPALDTEYIEFGFDVAAGYEVELTQVVLVTRSSNTGPGTLGLYTSLDGFASPIITLTQAGTVVLRTTVDLSALRPERLPPVTGPFLVRLIEIGNTQADGSGETAAGGTFRVGDSSIGAQFDGEIVNAVVGDVPEPGMWLVFALLSLAVLGRLGRHPMGCP